MSTEKTEQNDNSKKSSNRILIIVCVIALVIIITLIGVIFFMMNSEDSSKEAEKRAVVVVPENAEEAAEKILSQTEVEEGIPLHYQVKMNSTWEFENGQAESRNAYVENAKDNETAVYFDVVRNDTQETIYQSPIIPLGQSISNIRLDKNLDAGDYECTLTYYLIDDDQNALTTVNMWVMIKIEN